MESRQQWSVEVPRLRPVHTKLLAQGSKLRLCAKKGGIPRSATEAGNCVCAGNLFALALGNNTNP